MFDVFVQAVGFLGMALYIGSYQCKSGRRLLLVQMLGAIVYATHFFLLTAYSGALIQLVTALNCAILSFGSFDPKTIAGWRGWKWVFSAFFVFSSALAWKGVFDILPCIGSVATTLAAWTRNGKDIRIAKFFVSGPSWAIYDIIEHSYPGVITQVIGMVSIAVSVWRYGWEELDQKN